MKLSKKDKPKQKWTLRATSPQDFKEKFETLRHTEPIEKFYAR